MKSLEDIAADVLSDEKITKALETAEEIPPMFNKNQAVNWQGRAGTVNQVFSNGTVEIAITEYVTVNAKDLR